MSQSKKLDIVFDFNAVEVLESEGLSLLDGGLQPEALKKMATYTKLIRVGLLHRIPEATLADVRTVTKGMSPHEVIDQVTKALQESLGNDESSPTPTAAS